MGKPTDHVRSVVDPDDADLAGVDPTAGDNEPDSATGATDTGDQSETGQEADVDEAPAPAPAVTETAVDVTAENRETRDQ